MLGARMLRVSGVAAAGGLGAYYVQQRSSGKGPAALAARRSGLAAFAGPVAPGATGPFGNPAHGWDYYGKCLIGGILSCGLTHLAVTPLDVVKCRMQTQPEVYKGMGSGFAIASKEGALLLGWAPTLIGYSLQGMFKFGLYEIFKDYYATLVGPETAVQYRTFVWLAASASAEVFADVALCPFEAVKVKMQTSLPAANFPTTFGPAWARVSKDGGFFRGLAPLWGRQVPYTMVKFAAFERVIEAFYTYVFTEPKSSYSKTTQLSITFASGYIAGVLCALVSQPADTLVSQMNKNPELGAGALISKLGVSGLYGGLGPRVVMVGTLTGLQWWIYDSFKTAMGLATAGGAPAVKKA